jgi:predicted nucleotidyltransferase
MINKIYSYLSKENIVAIYPYGSRVYGTANDKSDYDFIVVHNTDFPTQEIVCGNMNIHFYDVATFQKALDDHENWAIECYFLPKDKIIQDTNMFSFTLDKSKLRTNFSAKASNSFVKCKKKFIDGELYIGQKSLFHSLRIISFGIHLATEGKLYYDTANGFYDEILKYDNWEALKEKYQPIYNKLSSEFRIVAPK